MIKEIDSSVNPSLSLERPAFNAPIRSLGKPDSLAAYQNSAKNSESADSCLHAFFQMIIDFFTSLFCKAVVEDESIEEEEPEVPLAHKKSRPPSPTENSDKLETFCGQPLTYIQDYQTQEETNGNTISQR